MGAFIVRPARRFPKKPSATGNQSRRVVLALLPQRLQEVLAVHDLLRVHHFELDQLLHHPDGPVLTVLLDLLPALCLGRGLSRGHLLDNVLQLWGELGDQDKVLVRQMVSQRLIQVYSVSSGKRQGAWRWATGSTADLRLECQGCSE